MSSSTCQNLYRTLNGLRHFGAGCKVTRSTYKYPDTYWLISRVKLKKDQEHGKAYGTLTWRGKQRGGVQKIGSTGKSQWTLISTPDYRNFVPDPTPPPPQRKVKTKATGPLS